MAVTTNYSWSTPDNTSYVKDGASSIRTLGSSVDTTLFTALGGAYPGLRLIKKQTIGSAVASVAVTSAFSATYDAYRIVVTGGTNTAAANNLQIKFGAMTAGAAYAFQYVSYGGSSVSAASNSNNSIFDYVGSADPSGQSMDLSVVNPFLAKWTTISGPCLRSDLGGHTTGVLKDTTSYTGFTILSSLGSMTGGTIYVYGYGAS